MTKVNNQTADLVVTDLPLGTELTVGGMLVYDGDVATRSGVIAPTQTPDDRLIFR